MSLFSMIKTMANNNQCHGVLVKLTLRSDHKVNKLCVVDLPVIYALEGNESLFESVN